MINVTHPDPGYAASALAAPRQSQHCLVGYPVRDPANIHNTDTRRVTNDTTQQQSDSTTTKSERQILIEELKRLQSVFASNDKEKIADLFSFPISNETVGIYIDDSTFNAQLDKNGNKVTRPMFIRFYPDISASLQIKQINQLFKKLDVDRLSHMDTLQHEAIIKSEPCYHYHALTTEKELVTLTIGTNSNEDYKSKTVSEDEIAENSSEFCEHVLWWVFRFDGKKLHFKNISGAG
ncbi:MAG: hypothetical protein EOO06_20435 [Chitinophagaceae bacterium]|nr:MAG: hypothetical protein EOO06_20435 [Chitinophagaceae bacterium]